jgi:hypothetical protein
MVRFFIGLLLGVILTVESLAIGGVGHGTYAPLAFTALYLCSDCLPAPCFGPSIFC